ncbi:hypothetical protein OG422_01095 [Streptomyces sp. NBC_01525]|uniref:hypothetical protein n=1 Tax=Streptomyces sp. NBC_01525 TaxID=2903893 RepID=UPI0038650E73
MLHTTVVHTGNDVRDTLDKGVERLATGRELAHKEVLAKLDGVAQGEATLKALSGVREELRAVGRSVGSLKAKAEEAGPSSTVDVQGEVAAALGSLGEDVKSLTGLLGDLHEELVKLRTAEPGPSTAANPQAAAEVRAVDSSAGGAGCAEVGVDADADAGADAGHLDDDEGPADPADRPGGRVPVSVAAPEVEGISVGISGPSAPGAVPASSAVIAQEASLIPSPRAALADVLKEAVAPLQGELARARKERQERQEESELAVKYGELANEMASLRKVVVGIAERTAGEVEAAPEAAPEATVTPLAAPESTAVAPADGTAHRRLLLQAARVSSTVLVCHRDVWEFVSATAGRHRHFRMPSEVIDEGAGRVSAALSGRSLIAMLISLFRIRTADDDGDGDLPLATTLYLRIEQALTALASDGSSLTIVLDDRSAPDPREAAGGGARHRRDPDGTGGRQNAEPGSVREPSRPPEDDGEALAG